MRVVVVAFLAIFVAACAGTAGPRTSTGPSTGPSTAPSLAPSLAPSDAPSSPAATATPANPSAPAGPVRIAVTLTDTFRIEPATMAVPVGAPVTFVVTNAGVLEHEFFVGDEAAQAEHEQEMIANGGMMHDHSNAVGVKPGATKELTMTFEAAADLLAGCHIAGHYAAGMQAAIEVGG